SVIAYSGHRVRFFRFSMHFLSEVPGLPLFWRECDVDRVWRDAAMQLGAFVVAYAISAQAVRFGFSDRFTKDRLCLLLGDQLARIGQCGCRRSRRGRRTRLGCGGGWGRTALGIA